MRNIIFYIPVLLFFSCTKSGNDINMVKKSVYIPSNYKFIDLKKSEDYLTDGSSELTLVLEISGNQYIDFIEKNKLIKFKESYRWQNYYQDDFNFYPYEIRKELNLPKCKNIDNFYYNYWDENEASIECFFDSNIGLVVIKYEW